MVSCSGSRNGSMKKFKEDFFHDFPCALSSSTFQIEQCTSTHQKSSIHPFSISCNADPNSSCWVLSICIFQSHPKGQGDPRVSILQGHCFLWHWSAQRSTGKGSILIISIILEISTIQQLCGGGLKTPWACHIPGSYGHFSYLNATSVYNPLQCPHYIFG